MRLYEKATHYGEEELSLFLSEPRFTLFQKVSRRIRQFIGWVGDKL